jgi:hypothetical protein
MFGLAELRNTWRLKFYINLVLSFLGNRPDSLTALAYLDGRCLLPPGLRPVEDHRSSAVTIRISSLNIKKFEHYPPNKNFFWFFLAKIRVVQDYSSVISESSKGNGWRAPRFSFRASQEHTYRVHYFGIPHARTSPNWSHRYLCRWRVDVLARL